MQGNDISDVSADIEIPLGKVKEVTVKQRINQSFFRKTVLTSYGNACCITGLNNQSLLIASHIKPWNISSDIEKTNPRNGLCLNALHDKAFDKGLITITPDNIIHISDDISDIYDGKTVDNFFRQYDKKRISVPEKFAPDKEYLTYHNDMIFENWR